MENKVNEIEMLPKMEPMVEKAETTQNKDEAIEGLNDEEVVYEYVSNQAKSASKLVKGEHGPRYFQRDVYYGNGPSCPDNVYYTPGHCQPSHGFQPAGDAHYNRRRSYSGCLGFLQGILCCGLCLGCLECCCC